MVCLNCGKIIEKNRKWQKYCDPKCRNEYWNKLRIKAIKEYKMNHKEKG